MADPDCSHAIIITKSMHDRGLPNNGGKQLQSSPGTVGLRHEIEKIDK